MYWEHCEQEPIEGMGETKRVSEPRKPLLLDLKQEVVSQYPDIETMYDLYLGYAKELSTLSQSVFRIDENIIKMMAVMQHQETMSNEGVMSNFNNTMENIGTTWVGDVTQFLGVRNKPQTQGKLQIKIHDFKRMMKDPSRKSLLGKKSLLADVNYIIERHIPGTPAITDVDALTYKETVKLLKNNVISFYIAYRTFTEYANNLKSMAGRAEGYEKEDILYTTHFLQNHTAPAMYSAIVIQNILQLARTPHFNINLWEVGVRRDLDLVDLKTPFSLYGKDKIRLDGTYSPEIQRVVRALQKKGVYLDIQTNKSDYITSVNHQPLFAKKYGFQVEYFDALFHQYGHRYYPLLSRSFVEKHQKRLHDDYNYAFRKYLDEGTDRRKRRFECPMPASTERSDRVGELDSIGYATDPSQVGLQWDGTLDKATGGSLDCISAVQYMSIPPGSIPYDYSYLGGSEINKLSPVYAPDAEGKLEFHTIFANYLKPNSDIWMMSANRYESPEYFNILQHIKPGMLVGFGHEFVEKWGAKNLPICFPNDIVKTLACSMSHGGMVTRCTANQVRVAMASERDGGVVELPLFGPEGVYEYYLTHDMSHKKYVFFGELDMEELVCKSEERIAELPKRMMEYTDGYPVVRLDEFDVYHKPGNGGSNYCVEIARENATKLLFGHNRHIKFGDAREVLDVLNAQDSAGGFDNQIVEYGPQLRPDGSKTDLQFQQCSSEEIISSSVYDEQVVPILDEIKLHSLYSGVPIVIECYIDTNRGHKILFTWGSKGGVEDWYVIDTLRGPGAIVYGGDGLCLAYDYFTQTEKFYTYGESAYTSLYIRTDPVGVYSLRSESQQERSDESEL